MKAAIVVFHPDRTLKHIIGPFDSGYAAAEHSATLEWGALRTIVALTEPQTEEECGDPMCQHPDCQEPPCTVS